MKISEITDVIDRGNAVMGELVLRKQAHENDITSDRAIYVIQDLIKLIKKFEVKTGTD